MKQPWTMRRWVCAVLRHRIGHRDGSSISTWRVCLCGRLWDITPVSR